MMRRQLEALYTRYNRSEFLASDPVQFVHRYRDAADRETAGILAACLALGRVSMILANVERALVPLGTRPALTLKRVSSVWLRKTYAGFRHRFISGVEMACFLSSLGRIQREYGSLNAAFLAVGKMDGQPTVLPALEAFLCLFEPGCGRLLARPSAGSACKRINLYLRWMVRKDAIDAGVWQGVSRAKLVVPLDTHMFRLARNHGWTRRRSADMAAALEVTEALRAINPSDPLKYDFALTRPGILASLSAERRSLAAAGGRVEGASAYS